MKVVHGPWFLLLHQDLVLQEDMMMHSLIKRTRSLKILKLKDKIVFLLNLFLLGILSVTKNPNFNT